MRVTRYKKPAPGKAGCPARVQGGAIEVYFLFSYVPVSSPQPQ